MSSYDAVPYPSHAFPATAPDRLAVLGGLFGLRTADPTTARVLELGGSSGGNVLVHAACHPRSEVLSVDLSQRQIAHGRRERDALGVSNLRLEVADLLTWEPEAGAWDYVICHGVYSWVPPEVQVAILRACRRALAPHGVALVSWNANPGWQVQGVVRDAMRYLVDDDAPLGWRASRAKDVVRVLASLGGPEETPFRRTLGTIAAHLELLPDSYVAHEYLETFNQPTFLAGFTRDAAARGLRYLCDSHPGDTLPALHAPEVAQRLMALASSRIVLEQYVDMLTCRPFRTSLLVREDAAVNTNLGAVDLSGHWLAREAPPEHDPAWPLPSALLARVHAAWPRCVAFDDAVAEVVHALGADPSQGRRELTHAVLSGFFSGTLRLHRHAHALVQAPGAWPTAWPVARRQAQRQHLVASLWHDTAALDPLDLLVLTLCDGTRDRAALANALGLVVAGHPELTPAGVGVQDLVDNRLAQLAGKGMFVA